jgi:hypothetical protein
MKSRFILEVFNSLKRLKRGILDDVVGVGHVARPARQPAAGPATERRAVPGEQLLQSGLVTLLRELRTVEPPLFSATYRLYIARIARDAAAAVDPCTPLHAGSD